LEIIGYIASVFVGLLLGLLGGGGSILSIPILVYLFQIDAVLASAYSLFIVGTTSLVGTIPKYRDHLVNVRTGFLFGIPSVLATFITRRWIVPTIPEVIFQTESFALTKRLLIMGVFSIIMILASVSMIRGRKEIKNLTGSLRIPLTILEGLLIGFITGLVGAGGGFLIIPALVLLTRLPMKTASGTSLFIIAINSLVGFGGDVLITKMDWTFLLAFTSIAIVGVFVGNQLSQRISGIALRKAFGWFTLLMGGSILFWELFAVH
jgi:uncharacterized membrane protein YfcA